MNRTLRKCCAALLAILAGCALPGPEQAGAPLFGAERAGLAAQPDAVPLAGDWWQSFDDAELEGWRAAILTAPHLLDRVSLIATADRERLVALVAARMGADPAEDSRPGLLVQLSFAAADFAFGQWVRDRGPRHRPLAADVTDAVAVVAHPRWRG